MCPHCGHRYPEDFRVCPRDAVELQDVPPTSLDELLGVVLGDAFCIVRAIGEGGMARVYEARHIRLKDKRFAVKVLHDTYAQSQDIVTRFRREAEAASAIAHPNVVDVFDVHLAPDGRPYMVSEFLEGKDLDDLLKERGTLDPLLTIDIVQQVCRGLTAAHAHGVVHRDMKPANVFLVGKPDAPVVKVLDFGISKMTTAGATSLTQTGMIMGTPAYMAPEQASGGVVDHRADIYSVGAILYRALTGHDPFEGDEAAEVLGGGPDARPERPRSIAPSIPPALEVVIQRAMAKDPSERYQTMETLEIELAPFGAEARALSLPPLEQARDEGSGAHSLGRRKFLSSATIVEQAGSAALAARATADARYARSLIVLFTLLAYTWGVICLLDAVLAVWSFQFKGGVPAGKQEAMYSLIGIAALGVTPLVLWALHVKRTVWANSARAVEYASLLRRVVTAAVAAYALAAVAGRLLPLFRPGRDIPLGEPVWGLLLGAAAFSIAAVVYLVVRGKSRA